MLDPRIYRVWLIAVALAVVVFAFSLYDQQGPVGTTLAPDAFNGQNAFSTMTQLAATYPKRPPGSSADQAIAAEVATQLSGDGFAVSRSYFRARTAVGPRTLENVVGVRPGLSGGSVVVVAHRDALGSPSVADASGTAVLLELAQVLSGETQQRTVVLASTSGSVGAAGASQLARTVAPGTDAVIVLGDLASTRPRGPTVVPWSDDQSLAPPLLRNTAAAALTAQAGLPSGQDSLEGQFAHLAFPMAPSEQAPFEARGEPAVLLSLSGESAPAAHEPTSAAQITAMGRTVLQTVSALDGSQAVPAPSAYLLFEGQVIPGWAIRLLVLALIVPVLVATIDGSARARRRGHSILGGLTWVLAAAVPFVLAVLAVLGSRLVGLIVAAPPGPVGPGAVPLHGKGAAVLAIAICLIGGSFVVLRMLARALASRRERGGAFEPYSPGAGSAVLLVLCATTLAIWITNPFAAALLIPALHLWMWIVDPSVRLRRWLVVALVLAGLAMPAAVALYWALTVGLSPVGAAWNGVLLIAGGPVSVLSAVEWSLVVGCAVSVFTIALGALRQARPEEGPITVRGPVSYAGPGSLGGTESALRR